MATTMGLAPALRRGRAGGLFWSMFSIGNFASPIIMVAVTGAVGSLGTAFIAAAVVSLVVAVLAAAPAAGRVLRSTPRPVAR